MTVGRFKIVERYSVLKLYSVLWPYGRLLALVLLLSGLGTVLGLLPPLITGSIIDQGILAKDAGRIAFFVALLVVLHVTSTTVGVLRGYFQAVLSGRVAMDLRTRVFGKALDLGVELYESAEVGDIATRIYGYVDRIQRFLVSSFETIVLNSMQLVGMLIVVFTLNPTLSLIMLIPLPLYMWGLIKYQPRARILFRRTWGAVSKMSAYVTSLLNSIILVKLVGKENVERQRFNTLAYDVYDANIEATKYGLRVFPWLDLLLAFASVGVLYFGGHMVLNGQLSLGMLTVFLAYVWQVYGPIRAITNLIPGLTEAEAAYEKLREIMEAVPSVAEAPDAIDVRVKGELEVRDVWFEYTPGRPILKGVNMRVGRGESVGIVGPNGSGKSTLARLLVRLFDPVSGSVLLDGVDMRKIKISSLKRNVVLVPQEPMLLAGSVAFNIAYGSDEADPLSIMYAAWLCGAHGFIIELPLAYDSDVGEHGKLLSGGQKQLICLARAVLLNPRILILDEATSNVHIELEETVLTRLLGYLPETTIISISHRPTLNKFVNRVILMAEGRVIGEERGGLEERPLKPPALRVVEPAEIEVVDRGAWLEARVGDTVLRELRVRMPFPLTNPQLLVLYRDPEDMIVVKNWYLFSEDTQRILLRHLKREHGLKMVSRLYDVVPEMRFIVKVSLEDEDGRKVDLSVTLSNLLKLDNNLVVIGPRELYVADLAASCSRDVAWKVSSIASTPDSALKGARIDLLVKALAAEYSQSAQAR